MTKEQQLYFLYGYLYATAKEMKQDGVFEEWSVSELISLLIPVQEKRKKWTL